MNYELISALIAIAVSVVTNKILAMHTFKVIDGYINDLFEIAKQSIRDAYFDKRMP